MVISCRVAFAVHAQGKLAAAAHELQHPAFHVGAGGNVGVVQLFQDQACSGIVAVGLPGQYALGRRGYEFPRIQFHEQQVRDIEAEAAHAGSGQENGVEIAGAQFVETCRHVATNVFELHVWPEIEQLRFAAVGGSSDHSALFQFKYL